MAKASSSLLSQVIRVYEDRSHPGLAKAKTRGEVSISTRKIYKQKGTGGARHGAKSAPIFVGGGVAHGPKGIKRVLRLPKKMAQKALLEILRMKKEEGKLFIEGKVSSVGKTKEAKILLDKLTGDRKRKRTVLIIVGKEAVGGRAFRNIKNSKVLFTGSVSAYDIFKADTVLMDEASASFYGLAVKDKPKVKPAAKAKTAKVNKVKKEISRKGKK